MNESTTIPTSNQENAPEEGYEQEVLNLGAFPIDSLMIRTESRTVFEVCRRIDSKQYIMDPDFQRDFVWDQGRQSKLIESAILRVPLPVFYLAETRHGRVVVVDGLQRLTTLHRYLGNQFALRGLDFARDLNNRKFSDLPPILQNRIEDIPLTLYLIDSSVPEEAKYEIFDRVNGGVPLTRQQMRNCLYVGEATRWLREMSKDQDFLDATGSGLSWKTMRDRECINRFAGFYLSGHGEYTGKMEPFLNAALQKMNEMDVARFQDLGERFRRSMRNNHRLFGPHAFRKSIAEPEGSRSVINVALFDVFSVTLADAAEETIVARKEEIVAAIRELLGRADYDEAISRSTNSARNVALRFDQTRQALDSLLQ